MVMQCRCSSFMQINRWLMTFIKRGFGEARCRPRASLRRHGNGRCSGSGSVTSFARDPQTSTHVYTCESWPGFSTSRHVHASTNSKPTVDSHGTTFTYKVTYMKLASNHKNMQTPFNNYAQTLTKCIYIGTYTPSTHTHKHKREERLYVDFTLQRKFTNTHTDTPPCTHARSRPGLTSANQDHRPRPSHYGSLSTPNL